MEIGRSVAEIADDDPGSHVINLVFKGGRPHWVYVGLPGHAGDADREVDEATLNRIHLPRRFHDLVKKELGPGATILVTNSRVGARPLERLTIMDAITPLP
ncbi:hypothetical protein [Sphingomonas sp. C3-2]|uniref:hypothetical protein n=1 Tax=Sphingomonas sp. C3-2 TaxID=3062169 RepID=UPI00294B2C0A|nr:hypothetical protein [Sphingomonas sp. C3-2]